MKQDEFVTKAIESREECDIDRLCVEWLENVSKDYGNDGLIARKLMEVVRELLCIARD